jgi:hypothetical protein
VRDQYGVEVRRDILRRRRPVTAQRPHPSAQNRIGEQAGAVNLDEDGCVPYVGDTVGRHRHTVRRPCRSRGVSSPGTMAERRAIFFGRMRHLRGEGTGGDEEVVEIDPGALNGIFAAPKWLRDLGFSAWLLVGVAAALVGAIWLLALTQTIVLPVITAGIIASVVLPLVDRLHERGVPRSVSAALVFVLIAFIAAGVVLMVL